MKIAVTAASGQLGRTIINQLIPEHGTQNIVGIARNPSKAENLGVAVRKGDYKSKKDFEKALKGIDTVMIVSGMDAPDKRIEQHRNIFYAAKEANVRKLVYSSIIGLVGQ